MPSFTMRFTASALLVAGSAPFASALYKGFNIAAERPDGSCKSQADWAYNFQQMKSLPGGFKDVRVYAASDCNTLDLAVPAAKDAGVQLLVGIWTEDDAHYSAEKAALEAAITKYGIDWISAISVGSEDLYRGDTTAARLAEQVYDVRGMVSQEKYGGSGLKIGHVDTYNAWNASAADLFKAVDFVGMDAYPYWQGVTTDNHASGSTFWKALEETESNIQAYNSKAELWITETGWPVAGPNFGASTANAKNAQEFWQDLICGYYISDADQHGPVTSQYNTWWYTLRDYQVAPASQSFGVLKEDFSVQYDLTCP